MACAEGIAVDPAPLGTAPMAAAMNEPPPSMDQPADEGAAGMAAPVFEGEACMQGDEQECTCDEGGVGVRRCVFDRNSPLGGSFSECERCMVPMDETSMDDGTGSDSSDDSPDSDDSSDSGDSSESGDSSGGSSSAPPPPPSGGNTGGGDAFWCIFVPVPLPGLC